MQQEYFSTLIRTSPELFKAIVRFNKLDSSYDEHSFITALPQAQSLPASFWPELWQRPMLRQYLRASQKHDPCFWDFAEESRRLILMDAPALSLLATYYGVALQAKHIAHIVQGEQVRDVQKELGHDVYTYALQRAQYQECQAAHLFAQRHTDAGLVEQIHLYGLEALAIIIAHWPEELAKRCPLALPPNFLAPPEAKEAFSLIWPDLKRIIRKEGDPQWAAYFA